MFIETKTSGDLTLTFIKSVNVQAYPCGRRRTENNIPIDPEARLNTEANNRKHSSLNGFTQTYLADWNKTDKFLTFALAGYLFNIKLKDNYVTKTEVECNGYTFDEYAFMANAFGNDAISKLGNTGSAIYANILLEEIPLLSGDYTYNTSILRSQSAEQSESVLPIDSLDIATSSTLEALADVDNYYFSGLSFSTTPYTGENVTRSIKLIDPNSKITAVSLRILEKVKTSADSVTPEVWEWRVHEPARLPKIDHGNGTDSIKVMAVEADSIKAPTIETIDVTDDEGNITASGTVKSTIVEASTVKATNIGVDPDNRVTQVYATNADITKAAVVKATINNLTVNETVSSPKLGQIVDEVEYKVPYITLENQGDGVYQLQISRIGTYPVTPAE